MKTPDITTAQVLGVLTALGGQAVAFGLLSGHQEQQLVSISTLVVGVVWKLADAWIRHGRSKAAAIQLLEQLVLEHETIAQATTPAPTIAQPPAVSTS